MGALQIDFHQDFRFARGENGVRLAYSVAGQGYPLVRATHWLTNIEFDWQTPAVRSPSPMRLDTPTGLVIWYSSVPMRAAN